MQSVVIRLRLMAESDGPRGWRCARRHAGLSVMRPVPCASAMAAMYQLDVSMTLDDLGWHFANRHQRGDCEETLWAFRTRWRRWRPSLDSFSIRPPG